MKYTRLAKAIALTMPLAMLAGCTSNDSSDDSGGIVPPPSSNGPVITFDPENGVVPFPSDLFGFDEDGTLRIPGESEWKTGDITESANAYWNYLGSQDGWGTSVPIVVSLTASEQGTVNINSDTLEAGVKLFKETENGNLEALTWNTDFRAIISKTGTLNIEPLKPFAEGTRYFVALTTAIVDGNGESIQPSEAYKTLLSSNDEMGIHLQSVIDKLAAAGISESTIAYGADFTTTSILAIMRPVVDKFLNDYANTTQISQITEVPDEPAPSSKQYRLANGEEGSTNLVVDAIKTAMEQEGIEFSSIDAKANDNYKLYTATINLPYYLDTPVAGDNCEYNQYVESLAGNAPSNFNEYRVAPQEFCPGAFSFWQTTGSDGTPSGIPVTGKTASDIYTYKSPAENAVKLLISIPAAVEKPANGFKTFMYAHGYGSSKDEITTIAGDLAAKGYAMIALDQPMHGDRSVDVDGDGKFDLNAALRRTDFVMGDNLLTTRGFMQQTMADYVGLRMAIANGVKNSDGEPLMDSENVHMAGLSLGGITSTSVSALLRDTQEQHPELADKLDLKTTSMGVPGGGVASVIIQSPLLEKEVREDFLESAAFRLHMAKLLDLYNPLEDLNKAAKVASLDAVDEYRVALEGEDLSNIEAIEDPDVKEKALAVEAAFNALTEGSDATLTSFDDFESQVWVSFASFAEREAQSVIDPSDPTNLAAVLAKHKDVPLFLVEAVGDGSNTFNPKDIANAVLNPFGKPWNPGDFIIVNQAQEMPLGGTDPLIRTLGLDILAGDQEASADNPVRGAARYGYGTHMSMAIGVPLENIHKKLLPHDVDVHNSIVSGIVSMAESNGTSISLPHLAESNGDELLLGEDEFPENPEYVEK